MTEQLKTGQEYKEAVVNGQTFLIYEGGRCNNQDNREKTVQEENTFTEKVMESIKDFIPLTVIDGGLSGKSKDSAENSKTETIVEYVGPKRLPRIVVVDKKDNSQKQNLANILNFLRRK